MTNKKNKTNRNGNEIKCLQYSVTISMQCLTYRIQ